MDNLFETVKQSITIREAAERYGIEVKRGGMVCCPFHDDKNPSMKLNKEYFYCFGCGATGDVIDLASRLYNLCLLYTSYNISTSSEKYHMNFYMYSQNDSDSKAVGLYKIEIALESEVAEDNFIWDNPPNGIFVGGQN